MFYKRHYRVWTYSGVCKPGRNQGEKPGNSKSNIPPPCKMPTTIFLNALIKINEFYLATMETIEINLILQMPL